MTSNSTKLPVLGSDAEIAVGLLDEWFDPIEAGLRDRVRDFGGRAGGPRHRRRHSSGDPPWAGEHSAVVRARDRAGVRHRWLTHTV